jgi:hypothetical protein
MSLLIALLNSVLIFFALLCGVFCASVYLDLPWPREHMAQVLFDLVHNENYLYYWQMSSAVLLTLVLFSMLLRNMRMLTISDISVVSNRGNTVQISIKALTDFIHKIVIQIDGIHSANVTLLSTPSHSKIDVKISLILWEGVSYPEVNEKIQDQVRRKIAIDMGIEKIRSIPVVLKKIIPRQVGMLHPLQKSTTPSPQNAPDLTYEEISISQ